MQDEITGASRTGKAPPGEQRAADPDRPRTGDPLAPSGRIGAQLRALYDEIEREPIPHELIELLEQLDEAEKRQES